MTTRAPLSGGRRKTGNRLTLGERRGEKGELMEEEAMRREGVSKTRQRGGGWVSKGQDQTKRLNISSSVKERPAAGDPSPAKHEASSELEIVVTKLRA